MKEDDYKELETKAQAAFISLPETHAGTYYPLTGQIRGWHFPFIDWS